MRRYVVLFTREEFSLTITSGLQRSTHEITANDFESGVLRQELRGKFEKLFNGDRGIRCGFMLHMGEHGPRFDRHTVHALLELDGLRLPEDVLTHREHPIPLGIPAEHTLTIGDLTFKVIIKYVD